WHPHPDLVRICNEAAAGQLQALVVYWDREEVCVDAAWLPRSIQQPTLVFDPTLRAEVLSQAVGVSVREVGVESSPPAAVQFPVRITRTKWPRPLANLIRAQLARHPGARIGVVLGRKRHEAVGSELSPQDRERVLWVDWNDDSLRKLA